MKESEKQQGELQALYRKVGRDDEKLLKHIAVIAALLLEGKLDPHAIFPINLATGAPTK